MMTPTTISRGGGGKCTFSKIVTGVLLVFVCSLTYPQVAGATIFQPGETLTPDCAPGSLNCGVAVPQSFAVDLAATTTTALAEGSNLYFTNTRADARVISVLSATTTLPNLVTLNGLLLSATQLLNFGTPFYTFFSATTTDALAQGSTNKYYSTNLFAGSLAGTTTTALAEGSNLYFTNTRADTRVAAGIAGTTTSALAEGTNLYYTSNRVASVIAGTTTTSLAEGTNLYFTNARADARINATSTIGTLTSAPNLGTISTVLSGILKATAGVLSTTLINLASDITGILPVGNGGTGWANLASGAILYGNGSSALATTSAGTAGNVLAYLGGIPTWTATSTLANISGTLAASQGGTGLSSITTNQLLIGGAGNTVTQIATSSLGLLTTNVAEGTNLYYTSNRVAGVIAATTTDALAQGSTNKYYSTNLFAGSLAGTTTTALAEGSNLYFTNTRADTRVAAGIAGTTTSALAEGSNQYFTNARSDARFVTGLAATSSINSITTLANLISTGALTSGSIGSGFGSINIGSNTFTGNGSGLTSLNANNLTNFGTPFYTFFSATTTDALTQGSTNKYYSTNLFAGSLAGTTTSALAEGSNQYFTNARVQSFIHASSTIPKTYTANIFTGSNTFNGGLTIDSLNGPLQANAGVVSATTSIGVLYGGTGLTAIPSFGQILRGTGAGYALVATSTLGVDLSDTTGTLTVARGGTGTTNGSITGTGALSFTSDTTNALTLDSGTTGTINVGTNANAKTINVGTGAAVVETINIGGTGANVIGIGNTQTGGSVAIGAGMTTGTISIGGTGAQTGTITIDGGTGAQTVNLATGAGVKTVNVGSTNGASITTIQAGSGGIILTGLAAQTNSKKTVCIDSSTKQLFLGATASTCDTSSAQYKHDIADIGLGLDAVNALRPVSFSYNSDGEKTLGFIAEEAALVDERLVVRDSGGVIQAINPDEFTPILTRAIQQVAVLIGDISPKVNADGSDNGLSALVATIQSETARDPVAIITKKIAEDKQFLTDFVAARITAIRGYFDEVFANKTHQKILCVGETDNETCITKNQLDNLLSGQNVAPVSSNNQAPTNNPEPTSSSPPPAVVEPTPNPSPEATPVVVEPTPVPVEPSVTPEPTPPVVEQP